MSKYSVVFEWPVGATAVDPLFELEAETFEMAKLQAAMLYAGCAFETTAPTAYRILQNGQTEVYRYPEPTVH